MFRYNSNITFVYYNDLEYASDFFERVLDLPKVMDQGFAKVYQVNNKAFLGVVKLKKEIEYKGNTLVSLCTNDVRKEYDRVSKLEVFKLTKINHYPDIPLDSFFFKDLEGHDFEIQQFLNKDDVNTF